MTGWDRIQLHVVGGCGRLGDRGNVILGADVHWQALRRATFEAQLAVDDFSYQNRSGPNRYPDRWALTLAAFGPLGRALGWRALYTQASSLAFRTLNPFENFTDNGVGLGRNFSDMDQLTLAVSVPLANHWLEAGQNGRAAEFLVVAGDQAGRGWAKDEAVTLYREALVCLPEDERERRREITRRIAVALQAVIHVADAELLGRRAGPAPADA